MAHNGSGQSEGAWPTPKPGFKVQWGTQVMSFQEVSGLDSQTEEINDCHGGSSVSPVIKMPGMVKFGNVTMKKGVVTRDNEFWDWFTRVKMNTIERRPVAISLLDETGTVTMNWTLTNAWPTKISAIDLKSDGTEAAIETIEFVHEGLTVEKA